MPEALDRIRRSEGGMTLIELMVSMLVVAIVLTIVMILVVGMEKILGKESDRSQTNSQARLAIEAEAPASSGGGLRPGNEDL